MITIPLAIAVTLGLLCTAIIYMDLRYMRIPDWISVAVVALFCSWIVLSPSDIPIPTRLITAGVIFAICFGLFAARIMGGGDTKIIPALSLFIPLANMSSVMILFAVCLFTSIGTVLAVRKMFAHRPSRWLVLSSQKLPMGVAIGTTGMISLAASHL